MNVLMTVISLLMVLMILTTARMESFISHSLLRKEAHEALVAFEEDWRYQAAHASYDRSERKSSGKSEEKKASKRLNRQFSIKAMVSNGDDLAMQKLLKRLIHELYSRHAFYKVFVGEEKEEKLEALVQGILNHGVEQRFSNKRQLAEIDFRDLNTQNAFAKMLNGRPPIGNSPGYPSLLDFLTTQRKEMQISVYLAERPFLRALIDDEELVREILALRQEIYRDLTSGGTDPESGADRLRAVVGSSEFYQFLDFNVSKTRPPK